MFEFLEGTIADVRPGYVVLAVNGVGYLVFTPDPYRFHIDSKQIVRIYVHQAVSDTAILLYGFHDFEDKQVFEKLIAVSGIGPKSALAILAGNDRSGLVSAINGQDAKFLTKFPGVGKKTAQQIILDLQGKLEGISSDSNIHNPIVKDEPQALHDALAGLEALGYSGKQIAVIKTKLAKQPGLSADEYLSLGMKSLMH